MIIAHFVDVNKNSEYFLKKFVILLNVMQYSIQLVVLYKNVFRLKIQYLITEVAAKSYYNMIKLN